MDVDNFITYIEVWYRLGRHLYGSWWTNNEWAAYPVDPPETVQTEKRQIQDRLKGIEDGQNAIRVERKTTMLSFERRQEIERIESDFSDELLILNRRLFEDLPRNLSDHQKDYDAYQRKKMTRERLRTALTNGEIRAWHGIPGMGIDKDLWHEDGGFRMYDDISIAVMPKSRSSKRRGLVWFYRNEIDEWLSNVEAINPENRKPPTLEEEYRQLIRELYRSLNGRLPKSAFEQHVREHASAFRQRTFDRAWSNESLIPKHWKLGGAIPKSERHTY